MSDLPRGAIALCRAGFEPEAGHELYEAALNLGLYPEAHPSEGEGFVAIEWPEGANAAYRLNVHQLVFCRTALPWFAHLTLPERDRVTPIVDACIAAGITVSQIEIEYPDTNDGKTLSGFGKRVLPHLSKALDKAGVLRAGQRQHPWLHLVFRNLQEVYLATSQASQRPPFAMGIPRLKMPAGAPSRSTLKLAEGLMTLLTADECRQYLKPGMRAVDLGAAPGGWTWQLATRGVRVTAIDNGPMHKSVMATEMVEHLRADGFTWRPRHPVHWLVCDMVEQPSRIAQLMADWVASGRTQHALFNLKLPMKKRTQEVARCLQIIDKRFRQTGRTPVLRLKQLYHDREEITVYLALPTA